jgi:hypothetical protein
VEERLADQPGEHPVVIVRRVVRAPGRAASATSRETALAERRLNLGLPIVADQG